MNSPPYRPDAGISKGLSQHFFLAPLIDGRFIVAQHFAEDLVVVGAESLR